MKTDDILKRAYDSNAALYRAFGLYPSQVRTAGRMLDEEAGELRDGLAAGDDPLSIGSEIADVLYTLMGVVHACGYTLEEIANFVESKCAVNDDKRPETGWGLNAKGKIVQR